ncbi:MAG: MBL fold metallo-hydrolase [Patescibacteria group bacterium]|nr:MBL fold metallo-hydrolase [Patescibacteria group bacterium]MDE2144793.1 MBL fold metallo-hydrolase [Patescibacteria group bacterium]
MKIKFLGGAGEVTGSNYLITSGDTQVLIDCGLFQGNHYSEKNNFNKFDFDISAVKAVFVTHAHIDHTGRLPKLYKEGYRGPIYSTAPTRDFAKELLLDSEDILFREAKREGEPPLYAKGDVDGVISIWKTLSYGDTISVGDIKIKAHDAGHILGSCSYEVEADGKRVVFSGDLGNVNPPLIKEGELIVPDAQYALIESAYGDRVHEHVEESRGILEDTIEETVRDGGVLMIPAFAMERAQELLLTIDELIRNKRIPPVPVFMDSPLAIKLTAVYKWYEDWFNADVEKLVKKGDPLFNFPGLKVTLKTEESKKIADVPAPKIIIAGSGMSHGGRIVRHEQLYLSDPKSAILFVGYQARGSLGRRILDGAETVRIFGQEVPVLCRKVEIGGYSAHADQNRLMKWLVPANGSLKHVFVVQGDEDASHALAAKIKDELAIDASVPAPGYEVELA